MPKYVEGNIWDHHGKYLVGIPCNIGWNSKGLGIMGAGLAWQAQERYPSLLEVWGNHCSTYGEETSILVDAVHTRLILIPTKPLDVANPHWSWKGPSTVELVEKSISDLVEWANKTAETEYGDCHPVALPWLGCGFGGLPKSAVKNLFDTYLDDTYLVVG